MSYFPILSSGNITVTSTQIKSIRTTPIQIIAAPGAGKIISVINTTVKFNYGGNNVFVTGGNLNLYAGTTAGLLFWTMNPAIYTGSVDNFYGIASVTAIGASTENTLENQAAVLSVATSDPTGNAANDNTLVINVLYQILMM